MVSEINNTSSQFAFHFKQDKSDPEFGSCLSANFYIFSRMRAMYIESECGRYIYSSTTTSDDFIQHCLDLDYETMLSTIATRSKVSPDGTWANLVELLQEPQEVTREKVSSAKESVIEICSTASSDDSDIIMRLSHAIHSELPQSSSLITYEEIDEAISYDYPYNAKTIVNVYLTHIVPALKEASTKSVHTTKDSLVLRIRTTDVSMFFGHSREAHNRTIDKYLNIFNNQSEFVIFEVISGPKDLSINQIAYIYDNIRNCDMRIITEYDINGNNPQHRLIFIKRGDASDD